MILKRQFYRLCRGATSRYIVNTYLNYILTYTQNSSMLVHLYKFLSIFLKYEDQE